MKLTIGVRTNLPGVLEVLMPQTDYGPVNITQGNSAFFTVEFYDSNGNLTVPSGGAVVIQYTNINNTTQTDTVVLSAMNSFFTGIWSSTNAALGLAPWVVLAAGFSSAAQAGVIRVIDP